MRKTLISLFAVAALGLFPCVAKEKTPVKVIAPDLIVESLEFGKFPDGHSPDEVGVEQARFIPTSTVAGYGYWYGYRIKLKTTRPKVLLWDTSDMREREPGWEKGRGAYVTPVNGVIYKFWDVVDGFPAGKHWIKVWIEDVELPAVNYTVKR